MSVTIFGIKNCDTMKKAFTWLDEHQVEYTFVDYKKTGVVSANILAWCNAVGWETLLNKKGLTWKKLSEEERADLDEARAKKLMAQYPSLIKRPVLVAEKQIMVGFSPEQYAKWIN
ncbi:arsenate reductase [Jezberella montanilacus]|jgi:arsenate reductase|uniref:Arsenate reductase n=1 Tax=Jezberella montanilacus TaxID=323426 RepID=A0A2T0XJN1_9BURK|nr:ArsC family reductase [Jezberella montanilacus]PRY99164.1 arsenate reductase [Jezberella montanilacus]|eukprot:gene472-474_t